MWPRLRGIIRSSASFMPRITPCRLMSIIRRAVRSSSSMKRPICMIPALLTSTSIGPELLLGAVEELGEGGAVGDVERQGDRARAQLRGGPRGRVVVHVADRHLHALAEEGFGGGAPDAAGGTGDRGGLSGEDAGLLGHLLLLGCGCLCGRLAGAPNTAT